MLQKKRRYLVVLSTILLLGMLAISLVSYTVSKSSIRAQLVDSTLPLVGDTIYSEIQRDLLRPVFIASLMATNTFVHRWVDDGEKDVAQMSNYLNAIKKEYNAFTAFFVSDSSRNYYHGDGILKQITAKDSRDQWYFRVRDTLEAYKINTDPDMANDDELAVFVNYRVVDSTGQFLGAIGIGLAIDSLNELLGKYSESYSRIVYFLDESGNIQFNNLEHGTAKSIFKITGLVDLAPEILSKRDESAYEYKGDNGQVYLNSRFIKELGWYLMVEQRESHWMTPVSNAILSNLLISLLLAVTVLALAYRVLFAYQGELEKVATFDKLTSAMNRQAFESIAADAFQQTARKTDGISLLLIDIDHFKSINDQYGHAVGDQALVQIVKSINLGVRASDVVCRWGGEEFCVLLKNTNIAEATEAAEHVRESIQFNTVIVGSNTQISLTASIGVSERRAAEDLSAVMQNADDALYLAKREGRNRVVAVGAAEKNAA